MMLSARLGRFDVSHEGRGRRAPQPRGARWQPVLGSLWTRRLAELESRFAAAPAAPGGAGATR